MRRWILGLLCFTGGLLLGQLSSIPGKIPQPSQMPKNYVKLKCLYGLAKDFEAEKGALPESMEVLRAWCEEDRIRGAMFRESEKLHVQQADGVFVWSITPAGRKGDTSGFYIRSGERFQLSDRPAELGVDREGRMTFRQP